MRLRSLLDHPLFYRCWQAPFRRAKLRRFRQSAGYGPDTRVLDVGCGPGTNADLFDPKGYVGVDLSESYIADARRRHGGRFLVADVTEELPFPESAFDLVLLNSFLHHLDDVDVSRLLRRVARVVSAEGSVHVVDLVMPAGKGLAAWLAESDRGDHPRSLGRWGELLGEAFEPDVCEPFSLAPLGIVLWELVYFKGRRRRSSVG